VFFGGQPQAQVQMASAPAPADTMQVSPTMAQAQEPQPFQVASNGPIPVPQQASAPGSSPSAAGTPPAAPPQAPAAGGTSGPVGSRVTPEQYGVLERLLRNPATHEIGMQYAIELQKKAAEPVQWDVKVQDGLVIATNPNDPQPADRQASL
jgi:hypothetical protein